VKLSSHRKSEDRRQYQSDRHCASFTSNARIQTMSPTSAHLGPRLDQQHCQQHLFSNLKPATHVDHTLTSRVSGLLLGTAGFDIADCKATIYGTGNNKVHWTSPHQCTVRPCRPQCQHCSVKDVTQNPLFVTLKSIFADASGKEVECNANAHGREEYQRTQATDSNFEERDSRVN
jgi:hypothetical protein